MTATRPIRGLLFANRLWLAALAMTALAAAIYMTLGFDRRLSRDGAVLAYQAQQAAQGIPPYVSAFDHHPPLAQMAAGAAVYVGRLAGLDDLRAIRVLFLAAGALTVGTLVLLGQSVSGSTMVGLLAAAAFVAFDCFGRNAIAGPREKVLMVLFQVLALWLTARRRWFWAGLCGTLSALVLQPAGIFPLITLSLAWVQSPTAAERKRNFRLAAAGVCVPVLIVAAYFTVKGALFELMDGSLLFVLSGFERAPISFYDHLMTPLRVLRAKEPLMCVPATLGLLTLPGLLPGRLRQRGGSLRRFISEDPLAVLLLTLPAPLLVTVLDFQSCPDLFILYPYFALGFAWLMWRGLQGINEEPASGSSGQWLSVSLAFIVLVGGAAYGYRNETETELRVQRQQARQVTSFAGPEAKVVSIGAPEILVLLHKTNPNPYVFIISGFHRRIEARTPGGLDGWLEQIKQYDPDVIALGVTEPPELRHKIEDWLQINYDRLIVGEWTLYVRTGTVDTLTE